ncbi:MAG TPA: VOC family protein [Kofleriaceae bacterium]|nr:VOC family protein [Kofleriaceae bacterium]
MKTNKHEPGTVCWVDLMTTDAEKARNFYKALFDWTFWVGGPETGHYSMGKLGEENVAGLGQIQQGMNMPPAWTVYFASDNLDATIEKIKANGGNVMMGPMDVMEEGRMGVFTDPQGAAFGVWQPKNHKGAGRIDEPGAMCWHEVYTTDAEKAIEFYSRVFGLERKKLDAPGIEYFTLHKGPKTVGGVMKFSPQMHGQHPRWNTYFDVADTDASVKKLESLGGKVMAPPFDTPYGRMSAVFDPTGAAFCLIKMKQPS